MKIKRIMTAVWVLLMLMPLAALAAHPSSVEEAKAMLDKALAYMEENGAQAAFDAFNDAKGGFVRGDLYVFAVDMEGNYQATGADPQLAGQSARDLVDAEGKKVGEIILKLAEDEGEGSVDYVWLNRQTNQVENKTSFIKKVGDYVIGVGYYH